MAKQRKPRKNPKAKQTTFCEVSFAKGLLRRGTSKSRLYHQCMNDPDTRREEFQVNKDGKVGKKKRVYHKCKHCEGFDFTQKEINADHRIPIVPTDGPLEGMDMWIARWLGPEVVMDKLCLNCHKIKTKAETKARAAWRKQQKELLNE